MKSLESILAYYSGAYPDTLAINSTGAATQDGTEYIAEMINNSIFGPQQALMDYAGLTPDGITEAAGTAQFIDALSLGFGVGPGTYRRYGKISLPAVTGDRLLILSGQGVLIASYPLLVAACYVGDGNNATAPYFFKADDAGGVTRNTAGTYFILPPGQPIFLKQYEEGNTYNSVLLQITGAPQAFTITRGVFVPYMTADGSWRLIFNINGTLAVTSAVEALTISGVTFKNVANYNQPVTFGDSSTSARYRAGYTIPGTGQLQLDYSSNFSVRWVSGDVELDSRPTWADDFDYPLAIVY
ncbi:MAG: hypothetical protein P8X74_03670 [Reinekea sp.]